MNIHPNSLKNLKPAQKGEIRNPKGSPGRKRKLPSLEYILADVLGKENKEGITQAQAIIQALATKARRGDVKAADLLLNRGYGKVKESIELSSDPDNPIQTKNEHVVIIKRMDTKELPDGSNDQPVV